MRASTGVKLANQLINGGSFAAMQAFAERIKQDPGVRTLLIQYLANSSEKEEEEEYAPREDMLKMPPSMPQ